MAPSFIEERSAVQRRMLIYKFEICDGTIIRAEDSALGRTWDTSQLLYIYIYQLQRMHSYNILQGRQSYDSLKHPGLRPYDTTVTRPSWGS